MKIRLIAILAIGTLPAAAQDVPQDMVIANLAAIEQCLVVTSPVDARATCYVSRMYACDDLMIENREAGLACMQAETRAWENIAAHSLDGLLQYDANVGAMPERFCIAGIGQTLQDAQSAWQDFRDASCGYAGSLNLDDRAYRTAYCQANMIAERAMELKFDLEFRNQFCDG